MNTTQNTLPGNALAAGHHLREYTLEAVLREGSHAIVYLARETPSQRAVVIKEYMPAQWAHRLPDHTVALRSRRHAEAFAQGLRRFVDSAQLQSGFEHASLMKVLRFWEGQGTAYQVMPYYPGPTLQDWLADREAAPDERWLKELLRPLLDALESLHAGRCLHGHITPATIVLTQGLRPVLLDGGISRLGGAAGEPAAALQPGYAALEQYGDLGARAVGAWTDLYALCAVIYAAMLGYAPVPAAGRVVQDSLEPIAKTAAGRYSAAFLRAIDAGLAVEPADRPRDVAALRALLFPEMFVLTEPSELDGAAPLAVTPPAPGPAPRPVAAPSQQAPPAAFVPGPPRAPRTTAPAALSAPPARARAPAPRSAGRFWQALLAVGVLALVMAAAWWASSRQGQQWLASVTAGVAGPPPAPAPEPFSIVAALEHAVRQADPAILVAARPDKAPLVVGRDPLGLRITSSQPGYLYVYLVGSDATHLWLLFPNDADNLNRIESGEEIRIPRTGWHVTAAGPPGTDHILTLVTRYPMDVSALGLRRDGAIHEIDRANVARRSAEHAGPGSPLAGSPQCPPGDADLAPCEQRFGAALLRIEEVNPPGPQR